MNNNRSKKRKVILRSAIATIFTAVVITIIALTLNIGHSSNTNDKKFIDYNSFYNGYQVQIDGTTYSKTSTEVTMTEAYKEYTTNYSSNVITISSAEELYTFSLACNNYSNFLDYDYKLVCNIDYSDCNYKFIPIGWNSNPFTGTFDGQGYDIKNLEFINITSANQQTYSTMKYFAMFAENEGEIKNFGLVDPTVTIVSYISSMADGGISNLCGHNKGTISGVYVRTLTNTLLDECGITAIGGYRVAGLCENNEGTITDSYYATNSVYNYTVSDVVEFADIALRNSGTISNTYFYNSSILSSSTQTENGKYSFKFVDDLGANDKTGDEYYGLWVKTIDELNSKFKNNSNWSVKSNDKTELGYYFTNETPIRRTINAKYESTTSVKSVEITISSVKDFMMMYELMNNNSFFASNLITYKITTDIDLKGIPESAYSYKHGIGANIVGVSVSGSVKLKNGQLSTNPTIYNASILSSERIVTTTGVDAYGLFPYLTGSVSNLNVYVVDMNLDLISESNNCKAIGAISGYVEGGTINNVNVYMTATNTTESKLGEYYLGGIAGILGGEGSISKSTVAGNFSLNVDSSFDSESEAGYMNGIAIGGAIGYIESSTGSVSEVLSAVDMSLSLGSEKVYAIGGTIGAGYTRVVNKLENVGNINIGSATLTPTYSCLYASGIIGRLLGLTGETSRDAEVNNFTNQGNVMVYALNGADNTYVSGILNADIQTSRRVSETSLSQSNFKDKSGQIIFYASAMTNRANINILSKNTSTLDQDKINLTSGINILASNGFKSVLSSVFNVDNNNLLTKNSDGTYNTSRTLKSIGNMTIDLSLISNYAPVLNVIGGNTSSTTSVSTVYNLRNYEFVLGKSTTNNLVVSGVANGEYISYDDVRNEGNLTFTFDKEIGNATKTSSIIISGVFESVSSSSSANNIYNSGAIDIKFTANIYANIYVSGICYSNRNGYTSVSEFNPSNANFDSSKTGDFNNTINNGNITITNPNFSNVTYKSAEYADMISSMTARVLNSNFTGAVVKGSIYASGITYINESVITNTFNLGDILNANYINETTKREVMASGIACLNKGEFAYIENSANNGDIRAINLSSAQYTITTSFYNKDTKHTFTDVVESNKPDTTYNSYVYASGIVGRNDELEDGSSYTSGNGNSKQIISFTINYGSVYAYNFRENIDSSLSTPTCVAGGVLAKGLLNIINVLNYGNVYGSEIVSGIFGNVDLTSFSGELSDTIYIANCINYASVYYLQKGYNNGDVVGESNVNETDLLYLEYKNFILDEETDGVKPATSFTMISVSRKKFKSYGGSIIGLANFANNNNVNNIKIRYLINLLDYFPIYGEATNVPDNVDVLVASYIYSAYKTYDGADICDVYLNRPTQYAALSKDTYEAKFKEYGNLVDKSYPGVFSQDFPFRKAINNKYVDGDTYYNTSLYPTDKFLTDYFQFVSFSYVNDSLMEKIGWKTIAYNDAATNLATSIEGVSKFLTKYKGISSANYQSDLEMALNTSSWSQYAKKDVLLQVSQDILDENNIDQSKELLDYLFSDTNQNSVVINNEFRRQIVQYVLEKHPELAQSNIISFENYYASILSSVLCTTEDNEIKTYIENNLSTYIENLSGTTKETLLLAYVDYLESYGDSFFENTTITSKYSLLEEVFENLDNTSSFYSLLYSLFTDESKAIIDKNANSKLNAYGGYNSLTTTERIALIQKILEENSVDQLSTFIDTFSSETEFYQYVSKTGYDVTSFEDITNGINSSSTTDTQEQTIDERVKLWNQIKNTSTFQTYFNSIYKTSYYKATEANNTYQSDSAPAVPVKNGNNGYTHGWSLENVAGVSSDIFYKYTSDSDITPSTYFYGPYANSKGQTILETGALDYNGNKIFDFTISTDDTIQSDDKNYFNPSVSTSDGFDFSSYSYGKKYTSFYINGTKDAYLTAVSKYYQSQGITNTGIYKSSIAFYKLANGTNISNSYDLNSDILTYLKKTTDYITYNGNRIELYQNTFKKSSSGFKIGDTEFANDGQYSVYKQDGTFITTTKGYDYINQNYVERLYYSTPTISWHPTGYTGIYAYYDKTYNRVRYIQFDGNGKNSTFLTTSYIDYSASQLYLLDGYWTNYQDGSTTNADERSIINEIFNTYLLTLANKDTFLKVVKKALLEKINSSTDNDLKLSFINQLVESSINTSKTISNVSPLNYLCYSSTKETQELEKTFLNGNIEATTSDKSVPRSKNNNCYFTIDNKKFYVYYARSGIYKYYYYLTNDTYGTFVRSTTATSTGKCTIQNIFGSGDWSESGTSNGYKLSVTYNNNSSATAKITKTVTETIYGEQKIYDYLVSKNTNTDYKAKILNAASTNQDVFVELIKILFDVSRTSLITSGNNTATDLKNLYETSGSEDGKGVDKGYALPISAASSAFISPTAKKTEIQIGGNPKDVDNAITQEAASYNIGYYIGSDLKTYKKTNDLAKYYYPNNSSESIDLDQQTSTAYPAPTTETRNYLTEEHIDSAGNKYYNGQYLLRIVNSNQDVQNSKTNEDYLILIQNGRVGNYTGNILVPKRTIWVAPQTPGVFKFVISNIESEKTGFVLHRLTRSTAKDYSTQISNVENILTFNDTLLPNKSYYFEVNITQEDIDAGYEYCISGGDSKKPYVSYIDMGASNDNVTAENTFELQTELTSTQNYNDSLNKLITYLTPLEGKDSNGVYQAINRFTKASTYDATKTYYELKNGKYVSVPSGDVTSSNVTNYYFLDSTGYTIKDYQNLLFTQEFKEMLLAHSNEAVLNLIKSLQTVDDINDVIYKMVELSSKMFDSIITKYNSKITSSDELKQELTAAYIATNYYVNYLNSQTNASYNATQTIFYEHLNELDQAYQYINSDGSIDNAKFEAFCNYIGYPLANISYGIYALSSSKGIENGTFIPDNLNLTSMDTFYNLNASDSDNNSIITLLDDENSSSWRDLVNSSEQYDTTNTNSVNYKFRVEMKQLRLSISTTIFELDLAYNDSTDIYATTSSINSSDSTIIYYVPTSYLNSLKGNSSISIENIKIADTASFVTNNNNQTTINLSFGSINKNGYYQVDRAITVTAEDSTVVNNYSIILVGKDIDDNTFTLSSDKTSLTYEGGTVTLTITSPTLDNGFDFKPFFTIVNGTNAYKENDNVFVFDQSVKNNGVVQNGEAKLVIDVLANLPGGNEQFNIDLYGTSKYVTIVKDKNNLALITEFNFEGTDLTQQILGGEVTSSILFGRAYDYSELTNIGNENFYLYKFSVSPNATVVISATYQSITKSGVDTGRIKYVVEFMVTSESGVVENYTHVLEEMDYFETNSSYANLYEEGVVVSNSLLYKEDFKYNNKTMSGDNVSLTYTDGSNFAAVGFKRGVAPEYRIKYILNNFYTLGDVVYSATNETLTNGSSVQQTYAGLTVSVPNSNDPGTYKYEYQYSSTGLWNDNTEYVREYIFPALYIVKGYSQDSLLNRVTFLDQSIVVGNTVSVMKPNTSTSSSIIAGTNTTITDGKEVTYNQIFSSSSRDIEIKGKTIKYNNGSDATSISDYYLIGTVSDSDLSYYAPTFGIEEHAQIYQYTTLKKLTEYGLDSQTKSDASILTNHDTLFLYVPFEDESGNIVIFLVEVDSKGSWKNVYNVSYDGVSLHNYDSKFTTLEATTTNSITTFTYNDIKYTISKKSGSVVDNQSLYMDYIGNPLEDHFWYVSYVVFSEAALHGEYDLGNIRYYHISIVDASNTIYFDVTLWALESFTLNEVYMTISENIYNDTKKTSTKQISGYLIKSEEFKEVDGVKYYKYRLRYNLQTLPKGYFYFSLDLPTGYSVSVSTDMKNQIDETTSPGSSEKGSFLPFTSIITKTIYLQFVVVEGDNKETAAWGVSTSDIYTRNATYTGVTEDKWKTE